MLNCLAGAFGLLRVIRLRKEGKISGSEAQCVGRGWVENQHWPPGVLHQQQNSFATLYATQHCGIDCITEIGRQTARRRIESVINASPVRIEYSAK